jgi:NAD(P)-dependent dehydrogenase (short-subunit alcohol dehydrogenase family)
MMSERPIALATPVALATGAGHRLGREFAVGLARAGFDVAVHYRGSFEQAAETARLVRAEGREAETFQADLADAGAARGLVPRVLERFSRLDVLLHAASPWIEKPFLEMTEGDWDASFDAGPRGLPLAQAAAAALRREGSILLIGDVAAVKPWLQPRSARGRQRPRSTAVGNLACPGSRVRVNGLAPGASCRPTIFRPGRGPAGRATPISGSSPWKTWWPGRSISSPTVSITGHVLFVDGGRAGGVKIKGCAAAKP